MSVKKSAKTSLKIIEKKYFGRFKKPLIELPNLVEPQLKSFDWIIKEGLKEVFMEIFPIDDYSNKKFRLEFINFEIDKPKITEYYAKENRLSYDTPLRATVRLKNKSTGSEKEQEIFLTDFPMMTDHGTFIVNGIERVVVSQLARSFGVFFTAQEIKGKKYFGAKIIPARGAWIEIESEVDGVIYVKIDRKRKFPITSFLRILGARFDKDMLSLFANNKFAKKTINLSLEADSAKIIDEAYIEIYKKLRDGDLATAHHAKEFIDSIFSPDRYDISNVGRYRFNQRFKKAVSESEIERKTISLDDIVSIVSHIIILNNTPYAEPDDIDHLGFRRVRYVGEMLQQKIRIGMSRIKRNIQDRMSTVDSETALPAQFINPRPLQASIKEFFATGQLSKFMSQQNILAELEDIRMLSALGPGGLDRKRAGFEVRDVHTSHYGRLCPIHTPEGPNIGLILRLATYARVNKFGMIETPYAKVENEKITDEILYLNAHEEENYNIAHAATKYDKDRNITEDFVEVRKNGEPNLVAKKDIHFIDIATNQAFSVATSMIPFLEHNNAARASMGSNMQKQAVPPIVPEAPLVATGIEDGAARDTGRIVISKTDGIVKFVDAKKIIVENNKKEKTQYDLINFSRTNDFSAFHQRPAVSLDDKVKKGDLLADTSSSSNGQIALGHNVRVAFMPWFGANYEDAIILSERLVKNSKFTSIRMNELDVSVRDTKLGPEITTHDIPNVGETKLKNLDEDGIVRIGAEVRAGDILVGKVTPKGESQLTPEERLLRSIFGEKAKDVKDTSLRLEGGKRGRVIGVKIFSRKKGDSLESGVIKRIHITIAQIRNVSVGDKLAGRHGNKGVISKILPEEDMPYSEDGEPIDVILTPLGVPSRMNLGQILELHLGLAANTLNYQAIVPSFTGADEKEIKEELKKAGFKEDGKMKLHDGRTGEEFDQDISVGYMYIMKLQHMVEDKVHMRSIGPYSLITQQPLGGKAQSGGQRFGEMEVWALLGYGAAYTLREMLTVKSDDILGRSEVFDAIIKNEQIRNPHIPAAFNVLLNNLRGLALNIQLEKIKK